MAIRSPQRGRGRIPAPAADGDRAARLGVDIRSGTPFFLTRSQLAAAGRRLASITALVVLDLSGLVLGLYGALVMRELYYGHTHPLWGFLWRVETDWPPLPRLSTALVAADAGREARRA